MTANLGEKKLFFKEAGSTERAPELAVRHRFTEFMARCGINVAEPDVEVSTRRHNPFFHYSLINANIPNTAYDAHANLLEQLKGFFGFGTGERNAADVQATHRDVYVKKDGLSITVEYPAALVTPSTNQTRVIIVCGTDPKKGDPGALMTELLVNMSKKASPAPALAAGPAA